MTDAQTMFQKDKPLFEKWQAIAVTDDFKRVIMSARASIAESGVTNPDVMSGVNLLATTLVSLCDTQEPSATMPTSGLSHDLTVKRKTAKAKENSHA